MSSAKKLADEHWDWLVVLLELMYKDAFIHGYKHCEETVQTITSEVELKIQDLDSV